MKRTMLAAFFGVLLLASALNIWAFERTSAIHDGGTVFDIGKFVEANHFDESSPIVLTNYFDRVSVQRLGNPKKLGISFSRELVRIFGIKKLNRDEPFDIRKQDAWGKLIPYVQYSSRSACAVNQETHLCTVMLAWNPLNKTGDRTFITYRISDNVFAIVDNRLSRVLFEEPND